MKTGQTINGCCHACQRQWSIELVAALRADMKKSFAVYCPFCASTKISTTDLNKPAPSPSLKDVNEWQQDSLQAFRERFGVESNCQALDKLDSLILDIHGMYGDAVKYPQLALHDHHFNRLERMMDALKKI